MEAMNVKKHRKNSSDTSQLYISSSKLDIDIKKILLRNHFKKNMHLLNNIPEPLAKPDIDDKLPQ